MKQILTMAAHRFEALLLLTVVIMLASCSDAELSNSTILEPSLTGKNVSARHIARMGGIPDCLESFDGDSVGFGFVGSAWPTFIEPGRADADKVMKILNLAYFNNLVVKEEQEPERYMLKYIDFAMPSDTVKYPIHFTTGSERFLSEVDKDSLVIPWEEYKVSLTGKTYIGKSLTFVPVKMSYNEYTRVFTLLSEEGATITFQSKSGSRKSLLRMLTVAERRGFAIEMTMGRNNSAVLKLKDVDYQSKMLWHRLFRSHEHLILKDGPLNQGRSVAEA